MTDVTVELNLIELSLQICYRFAESVILDFEPILPLNPTLEIFSATVEVGVQSTVVTLGLDLDISILSPIVLVQGPPINITRPAAAVSLKQGIIDKNLLEPLQDYLDNNILPIHFELRSIGGNLNDLSSGKKSSWESKVSADNMPTTSKRLMRHSMYNYSEQNSAAIRSKSKL